jgi:hypothetical protein
MNEHQIERKINLNFIIFVPAFSLPLQRTGMFPSLHLIIKAKEFFVAPFFVTPNFRINHMGCHR